MEKLINIKEASALIGLKVSMMRGLVFKKEVPYVKVGRSVLFTEKDLTAWAARRKVSAGDSPAKPRATRKRDVEIASIHKTLESLAMRVSAAHYVHNHISYDLWKSFEGFAIGFAQALSDEQDGSGVKSNFLPFGEYKKIAEQRHAEYESFKKNGLRSDLTPESHNDTVLR